MTPTWISHLKMQNQPGKQTGIEEFVNNDSCPCSCHVHPSNSICCSCLCDTEKFPSKPNSVTIEEIKN